MNRFLFILTPVVALAYAYLTARIAGSWASALVLLVPFVLAWLLPAVYWRGRRQVQGRTDEALHVAAYLSMGWLNFALLLALARDLALAIATLIPGESALVLSLKGQPGAVLVWSGSTAAVLIGFIAAGLGPRVRKVEIPLAGLTPALDGLRIVQISDLHVGSTLGIRYVRRVVAMTRRLRPDLVVFTGDIIDGPVRQLAQAVAPLAELASPGPAFLVLGNHEYYANPQEWVAHFQSLGIEVLLNRPAWVPVGNARVLVGGVTDPISDRPFGPPQPCRALGAGQPADLRILLAHHPKLAPAAAEAGFDLQLSGHTHGGQFFPWTLAVRWIHAPHATGLSRRGRMWVYVSVGTGSWGPPIRFGTRPELTLLRLRALPPGTPAPTPGSKR